MADMRYDTTENVLRELNLMKGKTYDFFQDIIAEINNTTNSMKVFKVIHTVDSNTSQITTFINRDKYAVYVEEKDRAYRIVDIEKLT
jgi:hypothetical protein